MSDQTSSQGYQGARNLPETSEGVHETIRRLAARLTDLGEATPASLSTADDALRKAQSTAERSYSERSSSANDKYNDAARIAQTRSQSERRKIDGEYGPRINDAREDAEAELASFERSIKELTERAAQELEESEWLAETLAESAGRKAEQELATARKVIEAKSREVGDIAAVAADQLRRSGFAQLAPTAPAAPPRAGFDELRKRAILEADDVRKRAGATFGAIWLALLCGPLAMLAAMGVLVALGRAWPTEVLKLSGAIGAGVFVLLLLVRMLARRRVPAFAARLSVTLGEFAVVAEHRVRAAEQACQEQIHNARTRKLREVRRARDIYSERQAQLVDRSQNQLPQLREQHQKAIASLHAERDAAVRENDRRANEALTALREEKDATLAQAAGQRDEALAAAGHIHRTTRESLRERWKLLARDVTTAAGSLAASADAACPPWTDSRWPHYHPVPIVPRTIRVGSLELRPAALFDPTKTPQDVAEAIPAPVIVPLSLDLERVPSLLLLHTHEQRDRAIRTLNQTMLRLVTALPPGKVRFTILDPIGLGQSFAAFMHLADFEPQLVSDRIWTDAKHIEQKLINLTEHMENVIQKYLRNQYRTIQEYNAEAGEVAEPFRFLVMSDFPTNLTEVAAKRLASIVSAGARCGVHVLISADIKSKGVQQLPIGELEHNALTITLQQTAAVKDPALARWPVTLDPLPGDDQLTAILTRAGELARDSSRVQVPFDIVAPALGEQWSLSSATELSVPIGRAGAHKLQRLVMGRGTTQHALIAGRTGAGKSTLFHVMITNLALWYSPSEVELYLVDFKKGVEFKAYATSKLPHARVIAVESEREFGLSVLRRLDAELTRRGVLFRDAGVQDVASYREAAKASGGRLPVQMPRVVLAVDEFQEFFVDDDKIAQESALLLDRLVRQGRAFGIHLVLGSQTLGGAFSIARSTMGQMAIRIALQSSEQDSYLIMSEENTAPRLLTRPGEAIYNDANGLIEGNSPFQIVWLPEERREAALADVRAKALAANVSSPEPIVFEGNVPAELRANHPLAALLRDPAPAVPPIVWLGEPISIKEPTTVSFPMRSGSNLLTVGQDEAAAASIHALAMLALAAQSRAGESPRIQVINAMAGEGESGTLIDAAVNSLGSLASRSGPREAGEVVGSLAEEVNRRLSLPTAQLETLPPLFLVVYGLQRIRDLRRSDDYSLSVDASSPAERFAHLLREGPGVGVHTLVWCDTATSLERVINRQGMREFGGRIIFQMSATDSSQLIDSPAAATLGRNRALFYSDETAGIEKFRPYMPPTTVWLRHAAAAMRSPRLNEDAENG